MLQARGLKTGGKKASLVKRLQEAQEERESRTTREIQRFLKLVYRLMRKHARDIEEGKKREILDVPSRATRSGGIAPLLECPLLHSSSLEDQIYAALDEACDLHVFHHLAGNEARLVTQAYPSNDAIQDTMTTLATSIYNHANSSVPARQEGALRSIIAHFHLALPKKDLDAITNRVLQWTLEPASVPVPEELEPDLVPFVCVVPAPHSVVLQPTQCCVAKA